MDIIYDSDLFEQNQRIIRQTNQLNERLNDQVRLKSIQSRDHFDRMSGFNNVDEQMHYLKSLYKRNEELLKQIDNHHGYQSMGKVVQHMNYNDRMEY